MHKLIDHICDELESLEEKVGKDGKLSMSEIQYVDTLAHAKKNLLKAEELSDGSYAHGMYADSGSYARGDGRGRGTRRGANRMMYSTRESGNIVDKLHEVMADADEHTRHDISRLIDKIEGRM